MNNLIEVSDLTYRPADLPAEQPDILQGINLTIKTGEFLAIVGENGSGKTTLLKQISGLLLPSTGQILINGLDTREEADRNSILALIGMVFQNPADQIVASTVEEDVAFGLENANLPTEIIQKRVAEQLEDAGLESDAARPPHLLSGGQIQRLAMAGVLARSPRILLFDEPTSMLDPLARRSFLQQILQLNQQGMTVVYVTHHMEETVFADQIVVMQAGKIILKGAPDYVFSKKHVLDQARLKPPETLIWAEYFRSLGWEIPKSVILPEDLLSALPEYRGTKLKSSQPTTSSIPNSLISLQDVYYTYLAETPLEKPALKGASMEISEKAIHGIAGGNGSGKSTLLQHINGILRPSQGRVRVDNLIVEDERTSLREIIRKVGLVFQSPETQFFETFVGDEIAYGPKQFSMDNLKERVRNAMAQVSLDFEKFKDRRLTTLSGGEKRKVAIASTLILDQDILLFDEPTAGMDPHSRDELIALFRKLNRQGKTIVIASHRLEELAAITETSSVMKSGSVIASAESPALLSDQSLLNSAGLEPPFGAVIVQALIKKGWPLDLRDPVISSNPGKLVEVLSK